MLCLHRTLIVKANIAPIPMAATAQVLLRLQEAKSGKRIIADVAVIFAVHTDNTFMYHTIKYVSRDLMMKPLLTLLWRLFVFLRIVGDINQCKGL